MDVILLIGLSNPDASKRHERHSVIAIPAKAPGVRWIRPLTVFGYDDAAEGHFEVDFKQVCVPSDNLILGEGRGFQVVQGRLGPGKFKNL